MRKSVIFWAAVIGIISTLIAGCASEEQPKRLEMDKLQGNTGAFQFGDLEWESSPEMTQEILGISFGEPDTVGGFQIYRIQNAYVWENETASITCEYKTDKLYAVTFLFMPEESKREEFWSEIKEEIFNLYGTVKGNVQRSDSDNLNVSTESEDYLWQDKNNGSTLMSLSKFSVNGTFRYIRLNVYIIN